MVQKLEADLLWISKHIFFTTYHNNSEEIERRKKKTFHIHSNLRWILIATKTAIWRFKELKNIILYRFSPFHSHSYSSSAARHTHIMCRIVFHKLNALLHVVVIVVIVSSVVLLLSLTHLLSSDMIWCDGEKDFLCKFVLKSLSSSISEIFFLFLAHISVDFYNKK